MKDEKNDETPECWLLLVMLESSGYPSISKLTLPGDFQCAQPPAETENCEGEIHAFGFGLKKLIMLPMPFLSTLSSLLAACLGFFAVGKSPVADCTVLRSARVPHLPSRNRIEKSFDTDAVPTLFSLPGAECPKLLVSSRRGNLSPLHVPCRHLVAVKDLVAPCFRNILAHERYAVDVPLLGKLCLARRLLHTARLSGTQ